MAGTVSPMSRSCEKLAGRGHGQGGNVEFWGYHGSFFCKSSRIADSCHTCAPCVT